MIDVLLPQEKQVLLENLFTRDENETEFEIKINNQYISQIIYSRLKRNLIKDLKKINKIIDTQDLFQQSILTLIKVINETIYSDDLHRNQKIWRLVGSLGYEEKWINWNPEIQEYYDKIKSKFASILTNKLIDYFNENRKLTGYNKSKIKEQESEYISLDVLVDEEREPGYLIDEQLEATPQEQFYRNSEFDRFFLQKLNDEKYFKSKQKINLEKLMEYENNQVAVARDRDVDKSTINKSIQSIKHKVLRDFIKEYGLQYGLDYIENDQHKDGDYKFLCNERTLQYYREKKEIMQFQKGRPKTKDIVHFVHDNFHQLWVQGIVNKLTDDEAQFFIKNYIQAMNFRATKSKKVEVISQKLKVHIENRLKFVTEYLTNRQITI